jgi:hypothetical protein
VSGVLAAASSAFPVPAPAGTPPWVGVIFLAGGAVIVAVLVMQTVRAFRDHDDAPRDEDDRPHDPDRDPSSRDGDAP